MPPPVNPTNVVFFLPSLLLLLQNVVDTMLRPTEVVPLDEDSVHVDVLQVEDVLVSMNTIIASVLHDFRVAHALDLVDRKLGWWVLPRSTCWFNWFVLNEFDDSQWLDNFRMTKSSLLSLSNLLCPHIERMNMNYRAAIPPVAKVACAMFKLM
jgi:hypothetical protein